MLPVQKTKVIGNSKYEVTQLGAIQGAKVFVRVLNMFGPAIQGEVEKLLSNISEDDVIYLCDAFGPMSFADGKILDKAGFDVHFVGKYKEMLGWLWFCLECNYGDFLGGKSLDGLASAVAKVASDSTSLNISPKTGSSGAS